MKKAGKRFKLFNNVKKRYNIKSTVVPVMIAVFAISVMINIADDVYDFGLLRSDNDDYTYTTQQSEDASEEYDADELEPGSEGYTYTPQDETPDVTASSEPSEYYVGIVSAAFAVDSVTIASDNEEDETRATHGDTVTVTLTTNGALGDVEVENAVIAGISVGATVCENGETWTMVYTLGTDSDQVVADGDEITFSFDIFYDSNLLYSKDQDDASNYVEYVERSVVITDVSFVSIPAPSDYVVIGSTMELTFETNVPANIIYATIAGVPVTPISHGGIPEVWTVTHTISAGEVDSNTSIPFTIRAIALGVGAEDYSRYTITEADTPPITFLDPLAISSISFTSDNQPYYSLASNGSELILTFTTANPVDIDSIEIAGQSLNPEIATSLDDEGMVWTVTYEIPSPSSLSNDTDIAFEVIVRDGAGQTIIIDETHTLLADTIRYFAPIDVIVGPYFISDNDNGFDRAKAGDELILEFTTSRPLMITCATTPTLVTALTVTIAGQPIAPEDIRSVNNEGVIWTIRYMIPYGVITDGSDIEFVVTMSDNAGNETIVTEVDAVTPSIEYFGSIVISDLTFRSGNDNSWYLAKDSNTLTISFRTSREVSIVSLGTNIAGTLVNYSSRDNDNIHWTITRTIMPGDFYSSGNVDFRFEIIDGAGNRAIKTHDHTEPRVKYYAPIVVSGESFESNNIVDGISVSHLARDGNDLILRFTTSNPINNIAIGDIEIAGRTPAPGNVNITSDNDRMNWIIRYTIRANRIPPIVHNTTIEFSVDMEDAAGNKYELTENAPLLSPVTYFAPIIINNISFVSGNTTTPNSYRLARNGDVLTLRFNTSHPVNRPHVTIAGQAPNTLDSIGNNHMYWIATFRVENIQLPDNTDIRFTATARDIAGNESATITETTRVDTSRVRYFAPIVINNLSFSSNNPASASFARIGDVVTLTFSTTHPVNLSNVTVAGVPATATSANNNRMSWTITHNVTGWNISNQGAISFTFTANDDAGNVPVTTQNTAATLVSYFAPIEVSNVRVETSNVNDGNRFARDDDMVTITFQTNHAVTISNARIAENAIGAAGITSTAGGTSYNHTIRRALQNGDLPDLATVTFSFSVDDAARNATVSGAYNAIGVTNRIQYFAPITADVSIRSDGNNTAFANNGTSIIVDVETNHDASVAQATIFNRVTENAGNGTQNLTVTYTIDENEFVIEEGIVPFEINITDVAGNMLLVNETNDTARSSVIYDRTPPTIRFMPDFSGFINEGIVYNIIFEDNNPMGLCGDGISLTHNGVELITDEHRADAGGSPSFAKELLLYEEGEHTIRATAVDLAGNEVPQATEARIVIIRESPTIHSVMIDMTDNVTPVFKSGLLPRQLFDIDSTVVDEYGVPFIREIIARVNDDIWDLYAPLVDEGRKTIHLTVEDMAGNSASITSEVYIRKTPPEPIIVDSVTNRALDLGANEDFIEAMSLTIGLRDLRIGGQMPDRFTKLQLVDENDNVVVDVLATIIPNGNGQFVVPVDVLGQYRIVAEAVCDALAISELDTDGNETGILVFSFTLRDRSLLQRFVENTPLLYSSIAFFVLLIGGFMWFIIAKKRKRDENEEAKLNSKIV
ncbi:MAG: hypothetical protein FWD05_03165 [Oscillospiraceae bacterium]|nr:hypothetical protein [Oscillospiraceae bacterium]